MLVYLLYFCVSIYMYMFFVQDIILKLLSSLFISLRIIFLEMT